MISLFSKLAAEMGTYISDKCKVRMKYVIQYGSMETLAAIHFNPRVYLLAVLQLATHNHMVAIMYAPVPFHSFHF